MCIRDREGYAKKLCPVDTGNLRNSITHVVDEQEPAAIIGTDNEYAACLLYTSYNRFLNKEHRHYERK